MILALLVLAFLWLAPVVLLGLYLASIAVRHALKERQGRRQGT